MLQHYITAIQRYIHSMTNHNLKCLKKVYKTVLLLNYKLVIVLHVSVGRNVFKIIYETDMNFTVNYIYFNLVIDDQFYPDFFYTYKYKVID